MKKYYLLFAIAFTTLVSHGQEEKRSFTLEEAKDYAQQNNESIRNALLDYETAEKKVWETVAVGLPQINFEGSFQHFLRIPTTVVDASFLNPMAPPGTTAEFQMGTEFNVKGQLSVSQILFSGSYLIGLKAAKNYKEFAGYTINKSGQDINYQVTKAYYGVLIAKENILLLDSIIINTKSILENTRRIFEEGLLEEIEVDQLELNLAQIETSRVRAERSVKLSENLLKFQMGVPIDQEITLTQSLDNFTSESYILESQSVELNVEENTDFIILTKQKELDEYNVKLKRSNSYPSLSAFFSYSQQAMRNEFNFFDNEKWFPTSLWGITLQIPITSSGQRIFQTQQAKIKVEQDENNIKQLKRSINLQESQARTSFQNAFDVVETEKRNMSIAKKIYKNTLIRKDNGFSGALQLSQAQTQLISSQQSYIMAVYDLLDAEAELKKVTNQFNIQNTIQN